MTYKIGDLVRAASGTLGVVRDRMKKPPIILVDWEDGALYWLKADLVVPAVPDRRDLTDDADYYAAITGVPHEAGDRQDQ